MSKQKHIIEVAPPEFQRVREEYSFRGYTCPVCNGRGGFERQVSHDDYKMEICDYCDGTGKIKAEATIKWGPDYN